MVSWLVWILVSPALVEGSLENRENPFRTTRARSELASRWGLGFWLRDEVEQTGLSPVSDQVGFGQTLCSSGSVESAAPGGLTVDFPFV